MQPKLEGKLFTPGFIKLAAESFAEGGQGEVFEVLNRCDFGAPTDRKVYKKYGWVHGKQIPKIDEMNRCLWDLNLRMILSYLSVLTGSSDETYLRKAVAWPEAVVVGLNGRAIGYVMRDIRSVDGSKDWALSDVMDEEHIDLKLLQLGFQNPDDFRYRLTEQILRTMSLLHEHFIIRDVNPSNILLTIHKSNLSVCLIDIDSIRFLGSPDTSFAYCETLPGPPEFREAKRKGLPYPRQSQGQDVYNICDIIRRIFYPGARLRYENDSWAYEAIARIEKSQPRGSNFATLVQRGLNFTPSERPALSEIWGSLQPK
jgi:serine/threonine protein kinase